MIIQEALAYGRARLTHSTSPHLDARLLLEYVVDKSHAYLAGHGDEALTAEQQQTYRDLVDRAAKHEPIPYLTGRAPFFGRIFQVTPAVLIPRPETEQLVESAIEWAKDRDAFHIVDVGTGSGCIAISLSLALPQATVQATDISQAALTVARQNAATHQATVHFHHGDLLRPVIETNGRPNLIVANLPYITDQEWTTLADGVKSYEPVTALRGGQDGLDLINQLLQQAQQRLSPNGAIFLEIGWKQGPAALTLAQSNFPTKKAAILSDFAGHDRIVTIT